MSILANYPDFTTDQIESECNRQYQLKCINDRSIVSRINQAEAIAKDNQVNRRRNSESGVQIVTLNGGPTEPSVVKLIEIPRADPMEQDLNDNQTETDGMKTDPKQNELIQTQQDEQSPANNTVEVEIPTKMAQDKTPENPLNSKIKSKLQSTQSKNVKQLKKQIQDMTASEINEFNDDFQEKYPIKIHGITLMSDNLNDPKWDNYDTLCNEIETQTGIGKYAIVEASIVHDTIKKASSLTIKVDDYDEFKIIREPKNWSQTSFGGKILSIKALPYSFFNNNFEIFYDLVINVTSKATITSNKIKQCEDTFHLKDLERIMNSSDGKSSIPTNRYRFKAMHTLAYVSACNNGIVLNGIKYLPEISVNHGSVCSVCYHINCRASKKKPCQSKARCGKCNETGHLELTCKNKEFCINCQKTGHKATFDGLCSLLQQKTFDNNAYLINLTVGEGIKSSKYALLRNAAVAIVNAEKEDSNNTKEEQKEMLKEMVGNYAQENILPRLGRLEVGQNDLNIRMERNEAYVTELQKVQKEHTEILGNVQTTVNSMAVTQATQTSAINTTSTTVASIAEMLGRLTAHLPPSTGPLTPPGNDH